MACHLNGLKEGLDDVPVYRNDRCFNLMKPQRVLVSKPRSIPRWDRYPLGWVVKGDFDTSTAERRIVCKVAGTAKQLLCHNCGVNGPEIHDRVGREWRQTRERPGVVRTTMGTEPNQPSSSLARQRRNYWP